MAQAAAIKEAVTRRLSGLTVEMVPVSTSGDKMQQAPLTQIGG